MSCTIKLADETIITANDTFAQVDDTYEYSSYCADYTALAAIAAKLNEENMKTVEITDSNGNVSIYKNMITSNPKFIIKSDNGNIEYVIRMKKKTEDDIAQDAVEVAIQEFDDETALSVKAVYPKYEACIGKTVKLGFKLVYYNILYKTAQATTISETYKPGAIGTESIYTRIDETHAGTNEDPIPYYGNQILEKGKIYVDDEGTLWICTTGTGIAVFDRLINLQVYVALYHDGEGTASDPIIYAGGIELFEGKYYIQNGVVYECIRNSETPLTQDLSALVDNYVKVYNPFAPVEPEEPEVEQDGSKTHPYIWNNNMIIEKNKYYIEDDVLYVGINNSGIELTHDLSALVGIYVQVVVADEGTEPVVDEEEPTEPTTDDEEQSTDPVVEEETEEVTE